MNPLTALTFNDTLGTKDHAVIIRLGEGLKNGLNLLHGKLLGSFLAERGEYLVGMVMVVVMVVTATAAMLVVIVVMMLVVVVTVATALAVLVVIVMVMLVIVVLVATALTVLIVVVMMMLVIVVLMTTALTVLVVIVMVMLVMFVATTLTVLVVMMMVMLVLLLKSLHSIVKSVLMLHSGENILAVQAIPGGSHDYGILVVLTEKLNALGNLLVLCSLCVREDDCRCMLDLVVVELAKVLHIHFTLIYVSYGGEAIKLRVGINRAHRLDNVGELAYSTGLNDNSVWMELVKNLDKSLRKIANERAADTTGIHLGDLYSRILKETAVNANLAKLILNKNKLLAGIRFLNKLLYKSCLTCAEETGKNIYFRHF